VSAELLRHLRDQFAFDDAPRRHDLAAYHVPFDELAPGGPSPERTLAAATRRGERLVVEGSSGRGKSSLLASVLGEDAEGVVPFLVPMSAEPAETVTEPRAMAVHLVQTIVAAAKRAEVLRGSEDEALREATPTRVVGRDQLTGRVGVTLGVVAAELGRQAAGGDSMARSATAIFEVVHQLLVTIATERVMPVLVFDDTDRWLGTAFDEPERLVRAFFGKVLLQLRDFPCSLVVAVHPRYRQRPEVSASIDRVLTTRIDLPPLPDFDAVARLLARRIEAHVEADPDPGRWHGSSVSDVLAPAAVERLFEHYRRGLGNELRTVVRTVHVALATACDGGAELITVEMIDASVASWSDAGPGS